MCFGNYIAESITINLLTENIENQIFERRHGQGHHTSLAAFVCDCSSNSSSEQNNSHSLIIWASNNSSYTIWASNIYWLAWIAFLFMLKDVFVIIFTSKQ